MYIVLNAAIVSNEGVHSHYERNTYGKSVGLSSLGNSCGFGAQRARPEGFEKACFRIPRSIESERSCFLASRFNRKRNKTFIAHESKGHRYSIFRFVLDCTGA